MILNVSKFKPKLFLPNFDSEIQIWVISNTQSERQLTDFLAEIDVRVTPQENGSLKRFDEAPVEVVVRNNTERNVDLVIDLCSGETIHWSGISHQSVGLLAPQTSKKLDLSVIPLIRGTHQLPTLSFTDTLLGLTYKFNNLYHLQVE